jgi:predicted nicotinamide N-methyase
MPNQTGNLFQGQPFETTLHHLQFGDAHFQVNALKDTQQFYDPQGLALQAGISSSTWSLFGNIWPSGMILADLMQHYDLADSRVLEMGCGLGLASLVMQRRGADVTASDYHPMAADFMLKNSNLNQMLPLNFEVCDWANTEDQALGQFDLMIGSDVLYEPNHAILLSKFIDRHAQKPVTVIIIDPDRRQQREFSVAMEKLGFTFNVSRAEPAMALQHKFKGKILTYTRH